jgi:hypothetical protein
MLDLVAEVNGSTLQEEMLGKTPVAVVVEECIITEIIEVEMAAQVSSLYVT